MGLWHHDIVSNLSLSTKSERQTQTSLGGRNDMHRGIYNTFICTLSLFCLSCVIFPRHSLAVSRSRKCWPS